MKKILPILTLIGLLISMNPKQTWGYYGDVTLKAEGGESVTVGQDSEIVIRMEAGSNKVVGVGLDFSYDSEIVEIRSVTLNTSSFATAVKQTATNSRVYLTGLVPTGSTPATGTFEVGKIVVRGKKAGSSDLNMVNYSVGGVNPAANPTDMNSAGVDSALRVNYGGKVITVIGANNTTGILRFLVTFKGVNSKSKCANNWPVKAIVKDSSGNMQNYGEGPLELESSTSEKNVYRGTIVLNGISSKTGLSLFLKGPKHVQVKYAKNGQTDLYNKDGGELSVTNDIDTTAIYNFSGYGMGAGDVNQDGVVNAVDFAIVKKASLTHQVFDEGTYVPEDLDGNCIMNTNDVLLLRETLQDKQDQIY